MALVALTAYGGERRKGLQREKGIIGARCREKTLLKATEMTLVARSKFEGGGNAGERGSLCKIPKC